MSTQTLPYKDPTLPIEERVTDLLSRMTLPEKIGQMSQIDRLLATPEDINNLFIGSVLNGGNSGLTTDATPSHWADMIDDLQKSSMETRLQIPILYGTDAIHGHNNVFGATIFPHNIGLGATRDEDLMVRIGKATALEIRATGIPYAFAPCIAVCRDPRWGRSYESYSEDTDIVRSMSKIILGLQGVPPVDYPKGYPFLAGGSNVIGSAKHYAGDGGTTDGINEHDTVCSYSDLYRIHIRPYIDAVEMNVSTIMVSYSSWNGTKMHTNPYLLTKVLKEELGFQGFLISDWEGVDRVTSPPGSNYKNSLKDVINAGVDMVMIPFIHRKSITDLTELVLSGDVSMTRIDDAVRRILRVKFIAGLFEQPYADRSLVGNNNIGSKEHRELAREAVRKSLVLLKNGNGGKQMLPLSKDVPKILVAGTHANDIGYQCGGWTITWSGSSGNTTIGTTILQGIKSTVSKETEVVFEKKPDQQFMQNNKDFSYAIVVVGEPPYAESEGDNKHLTLPPDAIETIKNVCSETKCLVIIVSGRPMVIEPHVGMMEALVAAWLPGSEAGNGIADVIFGEYDFTGKLPITWFRNVDQLPMNFGDPHYDPLYPLNFGLDMNSTSSSHLSS